MKAFLLNILKRLYKIDVDSIQKECIQLNVDNELLKRRSKELENGVTVLQSKNENIHNSLTNSRNETSLLREKFAKEKASRIKIERELVEQKAVAKAQLEAFESQLTQIRNENETLEKLVKDAKSQLSEKEKAIQKLRESGLTQESEIHRLKQVESELVEQKAVAKAQSETIERQLKQIQEEKESLEELISKNENTIQSLRESITEQWNEIHRLKQFEKGHEENQDELELVKRRCEQYQQQESLLRNEYESCVGKLNDNQVTIATLEQEVLSLKKELEDAKTVTQNNVITQEPEKEQNEELTQENDPSLLDNDNSKSNSNSKTNDIVVCPKENLPPQNVYLETTALVESDNNESPYDDVKRTIDTVIDVEENKEILASNFFAQPEMSIFKMRTDLEKAVYLHRPKYVCKYCGQMVRISGRKTERGYARFFSHLRDSDECDYKTTTGLSKREIERKKFSYCNEGERHKTLKSDIAKYLEMTDGVSDVKTESTAKSFHPVLRWRRPDVMAKYKNQDIVFELQLSTTFISVITERDLFYRLNKKHIIWVFNFDQYGEHLNLTNMMIKDIYYNNKMNIFIFDDEAKKKSEEMGELVLKCNWLQPDGKKWQYSNGNTSDQLGGIFVTLSMLSFDDTFKPFYVDAEKEYIKRHPEFELKIRDVEAENQRIIEGLNVRWEKEKNLKVVETTNIENRKREIVEQNEIDEIVRSTKQYIIGKRKGLCGLVTFDGVVRLPFIYDKINIHQQWKECVKDGLIDVFDNEYNLVIGDVRCIEELDGVKKYQKSCDGNILWGLINTDCSKLLVEPIYSRIQKWGNGKLLAVKHGKYCILDVEGNVIIDNFDFIGNLSQDRGADAVWNGQDGTINSAFQFVAAKEYKSINPEKNECLNTNPSVKISSNGQALLKCDTSITGKFVVPDGLIVIAKSAFRDCINITSIEIPSSVSSIEKHAFWNCTSLTSIKIPSGVTSIGKLVFECCTSLTSIEISNSVKSIGGSVFERCTSLTSIVVDKDNPTYDSRGGCNAVIESGTNKLMFGCQSTIIPSSVTSIGNSAFSGCTGLSSIEIPYSVTSIGYYALKDCSGLTSIVIPDSVTSIGYRAFSGCASLSKVLWNAENLMEPCISNFTDCPVTEFTFGDNVKSIPSGCCSGMASLVSIKIPEGVTSIGDYAFSGCTGLTSIVIPDSVTSIGVSAFSGCTGLTSIVIPDSVTSIGYRAFQGCSGLTSIVVPDSVTSIEYYALKDCSGLTSIVIPDSVTSMGDGAFSGCASLSKVLWNAENCTSIEYRVFNGCPVSEFVFGDNVKVIPQNCCYGMSKLTSITIPNSVTSIGVGAFANCTSLTSIEIPNSVTSIGNLVFSDCTSLTSIRIPKNTKFSPGNLSPYVTYY